jgi:hypothetical protein
MKRITYTVWAETEDGEPTGAWLIGEFPMPEVQVMPVEGIVTELRACWLCHKLNEVEEARGQ